MKKIFTSCKYALSLVIVIAIFATSLFTGVSFTADALASPVCAGSVSEYTARGDAVSLLDSASPNSESNPYIIANANQMFSLMRSKCTYNGELIDTAGAYFKVADGIKAFYMNGGETVANMTTVSQVKEYFEKTNTSATTVGSNSGNHFRGSFDGNGVTIYGIRSDDSVGGLFPYASGNVTIKNVIVKNSYLKGSAGGGGLVGSCMGSGANPVSVTIENCEVSNNYIASGRNGDGAGALLGFMYNNTANAYPVVTATNCIVYGNELEATHATNPGGCFAIAGTLNSKNCEFTNCIFLDAFPFPTGSNIRKAEVYKKVYTNADLSTVGVTYTEGTIMSIGDTAPTGATGKAAMPLLDWDVWFATTSYPVLRAFHNIQTIDGDTQGCACGIVNKLSLPVCAGSVSEYTARDAEVSLLDPDSPNSESNPYIIETANQMYMLMRVQCTYNGETIDTAGAYFKVANGIKAFYMNGGETVANMTTVAEIKNYFEDTSTSAAKVSTSSSRHFKGSFDGNGVTIYGIRSDDSTGGLFPYASGSVTIKNVTVKNSYLKGSAGGGGLVGSCMGEGANPVSINIENCEVSNNYIASGRNGDGAGALLGFMYNSSANSFPVVTAKNCIVYGNELAATHATNPGSCFAIASTLNSKNCKFTNCIFLDAFPFPTGANIKEAKVYEKVYTDADLSAVGVTYTEGTIMSIGDTAPTGAAGKAAMPLLDWDVWFATTSYPVLRAFHNIQTIDGDTQGCACGISGIVPTIDVSSIGSKTLIDTTTEWRYLDDNTDPANGLDSLQDWTLLDFDDSSWKKASGKFGSKAGALAAVNGCGTPTVLLNLYKDGAAAPVIPAYFFRTTLNLSGVEALSGLEFQIYADDGMVVYINGHIVCDSRNGDYSGKTTNLYYAEYTTAGQSFTMDADDLAGILQDGENIIAVEVHNNQQSSSDIYFSMDSMTAITVDPNAATFSSVIMNVGADETQRNLTWYTITNKTSTVQFAPATDMIDGAFPTEYETITASTAKATNKVGYYTNKATLTNLSENTDYVYRLVVDEKYSDLYYFTVGSFEDYDFVFVGDPQISTTEHGNEWIDTLEKIDENFDAEFIVSAGDQITTPDSEEQYDLFIADELASNAVATTIGPVHDSYSSQGKGTAYSEHYNLPNESSEYGVTMAGGNYWYIYNDTLFMNINFEAGTTAQLAQHEEFIRETINANPNTTWQVVIVHAPFFATSYHASDANTVKIREKLAPVFADVGIDVVLSGHEHLYARSQLMLDSTTVSDDVVTDNYVISPEGVQYICASSSTGSKFYEKGYYENDGYIAAENYEKRKSAIHFEVTDTSFAMTSYFLDDMSVFDKFTIYNTEDAVHKASDNYYISENTHANICSNCGKTYNSENHTDSNSDSICDVCGWPCGEHIFEGASITLTDSIAVNYMIKKSVVTTLGYDNLYIQFTFLDKDYTISNYTESGEYYVFTFNDIAPNHINDTIYATLCGTKDGTNYTSKTSEYSIKTYCYNMLEKYSSDDYAALRTLLVDMLNYGADSQIYTDRNTDKLANADLTDTQKAWGTTTAPRVESVLNLNQNSIDTPTVNWKGGNLYMSNSVVMLLTIETDSVDNLDIKASCNGRNWTVSHDNIIKRENYENRYYVYITGIKVTEMRENVDVTVYKDGNAVSNTLRYRIESYAATKINGGNEALSNLLVSMIKYGDAAKAYAKTLVQ